MQMLTHAFRLTDPRGRESCTLDAALVHAAGKMQDTYVTFLRNITDNDGDVDPTTTEIWRVESLTTSDQETVLSAFQQTLPDCTFEPLPQ
jgi:hypothetical protein